MHLKEWFTVDTARGQDKQEAGGLGKNQGGLSFYICTVNFFQKTHFFNKKFKWMLTVNKRKKKNKDNSSTLGLDSIFSTLLGDNFNHLFCVICKSIQLFLFLKNKT